METFSAILALCVGNLLVTGEFSSQRPVTRSSDVFFDLRLTKQLSKQSWGSWFETSSRSLRHCYVRVIYWFYLNQIFIKIFHRHMVTESKVVWITSSGPWIHYIGDQIGQNASALGDNDTSTCVHQDKRKTLLLRTTLSEFSSLSVTVVSNQKYPDDNHICEKSLKHPWVLMTHVNSKLGSKCDTFCGPLKPCRYGGIGNQSDNLYWHQIQCECGVELCDELALHIEPVHSEIFSICELLYT